MVNNILITLLVITNLLFYMVIDGYQTYRDDHFIMYATVKSLCSIVKPT